MPRSQVRVLSTTAVVITGAVLLALGVGLAVVFLLAYGKPDNQLEAIKTAGTFVVGGGGAAALYLTARRQRSNEIALRQKEIDQEQADRTYTLQERVAAATEAESAERRRAEVDRRITESYGMALEQLGSDKPAVRLGSLYALERLAQDNPDQRQRIVNVVCAYLRMEPETESTQEHQVRLTAQRLLTAHLTVKDLHRFWPDTTLDLTGATLTAFDLGGGRVLSATFRDAVFQGPTSFSEIRIAEDGIFIGAHFQDECRFWGAELETVLFTGVRFDGPASFDRGKFACGAFFDNTVFGDSASFEGVRFCEGAWFERARFSKRPHFTSATFMGAVVGLDGVTSQR
jgi:hypothetical protein